MFDRLSQMVDELNDTNSKNEKMDILKKYPDLKKVLEYTYDPYRKYGVTSKNLKKRSDLIEPFHPSKSAEADLLELLDKLVDRELTGHDALGVCNGFAEYLYQPYAELFHRILDKNLKTRTDAKMINKVWLKLIPQFDVALAQKFEDHAHKIDWDNEQWLGSRKLDGVRVLARKENGIVKFFSRQGNEFTTLDVLKKELEDIKTDNFVLDGEMCVMDEAGSEDYKAIVSQIKRKEYTIEDPMFIVFDSLTLSEFDKGYSDQSTSSRMLRIMRFAACEHINKLEMERITSEADAVAKLDSAVESGWEGYMIRNAGAPYEGKRTRALLKMKKMHDEEYVVRDIEVGPFRMIDKETGLEKTIETLTNVLIEHKGNAVSVGSGFSLDDRNRYYDNPELILGKEITVQYFELSKDKDGNESLRFPVIKHVFEDGVRTV